MYTTQPGVQLYTAYYLDGVKGKDGAVYNQYSSLCLESQNYPDAINQVSKTNEISELLIKIFKLILDFLLLT